jgi:hypothetical protein
MAFVLLEVMCAITWVILRCFIKVEEKKKIGINQIMFARNQYANENVEIVQGDDCGEFKLHHVFQSL